MGARGSVIFTGSIGLANAEAVFRSLAGSVGSRASRYPDGETQERTMWFTWQGELDPLTGAARTRQRCLFRAVE